MGRPSEVRYLKSHEWAREEGELVAVGISDFAVEQMNRELVYLELPEVGRKLKKGESFGVVESVKAVSELYAPVGGTVAAVNDGVVADPGPVQTEPYEGGWLIKITPSDAGEFGSLLSSEQYEELIANEEHH